MATTLTYDFNDSIKIGEQGEEEFIKLFSELPTVNQIVDLRNIQKAREDDIDFLVKTPRGNFTLELKTDTYTSGNFFIETMSAAETHSLGWAFKSRAQFLAYYFINYANIYIFRMKDIQRIAGSLTFSEYRKTLKNRRKNGGYYTSEGLAIPINVLCRTVEKYSLYKIENF